MPLAGVLCDDPREKGQRYSFDACLACARTGGPRKCQNPYQLIYAMSRNQIERKDAGISATMLLDCPRRVILQAEEPYFEAPSAYWPRLRGTIGHLLVEQYGDGLEPKIAEVRFRKSVEVQGVQVEITGKPDMILPERKLIIDYKSNKNVDDPYQPMKKGQAKVEHVEQVNIYRWLLAGGVNMDTGEITHVDIEEGQIHYFDMMRWLPPTSVPIWPLEETEAFIKRHLDPLITYQLGGEMPHLLTDIWGERHNWCNYCPVREQCDARGDT